MDVFAGLLVVLLAGVAEPPGSRLTLDRVADAVLARQGRLRRLFVEGYMTTTVGAGTQTDRFATAFVRGRCFLDFMHGTGANDPPWQDSARFELWLTSDRATLFKPFTRTLYPDAPRSSLDYWESPYGRVIGWHPDAKIFEGRDEQAKYLDHVFAGSTI